jgi:hypothetical protein
LDCGEHREIGDCERIAFAIPNFASSPFKSQGRPFSVALVILRLFAQVCLDLEFEFGQVGFQFIDLLGLGQELALETAISAAAFTAAVAGTILAITLFVHIFLLVMDVPSDYWFLCFLETQVETIQTTRAAYIITAPDGKNAGR